MIDFMILAKRMEEYSVKRFYEEAKNLKLKTRIVRYEDLYVRIGKEEIDIFSNKRRVKRPKMVVLRVAGRGGAGMYFVPHRAILINQWQKTDTVILNSKTYLNFPRINKLLQSHKFFQAGVPFVPSQSYCSIDRIKFGSFKFPVIVKNKFGSGGQKVFKADSPQELKNLVELEEPYNVLIQPFLQTGHDYRVIVLGGKALPAAMRKTAAEGEFLTNFARGGSVEGVPLTKELKTLAEKAAKIFECDYAGIDIMYDKKNRPHVLEVNRGAQFHGFEDSTGINLAKEVILYLKDRYEKKPKSYNPFS